MKNLFKFGFLGLAITVGAAACNSTSSEHNDEIDSLQTEVQDSIDAVIDSVDSIGEVTIDSLDSLKI